jgi:antitoxin MazE
MQANIIQIGNSKGIILPSDLLAKLHLSLKSAVSVSVEDEKIVIQPEPRRGWAEAFKQFASSGAEESFFPDVLDDEDLSDWTWQQK